MTQKIGLREMTRYTAGRLVAMPSPSGNDTLNVKAGKDKLYGGTGDDTLDGPMRREVVTDCKLNSLI